MTTRVPALLAPLLAALAFGPAAAPALAAPELGLTLERDSAAYPVVHRSDERVDFTAEVRNTATEAPLVAGSTLRCIGTPPYRSWQGSPAPTAFSFRWTRNGAPIAGAAEPTYTLAAADEGRAIQCEVTASSQVAVQEPPGTVTVKSSAASQPPLVIPPGPTPPPPAPLISSPAFGYDTPLVSGSGKTGTRTCTPPRSWSSTALAGLSSGSKTLSAVTTAYAQSGDAEDGSNQITGLDVLRGAFRVGQTVSISENGGEIVTAPPGTTVTAVDPANGDLTLSNPVTVTGAGINKSVYVRAGSQPFAVGEGVHGEGIPAGDKIEAIGGREITLEEPATADAEEAVVWSAATGPWSFQWLRNGVPIAGATASHYSPQAADENAILQCKAIGAAGSGEAPGGGASAAISNDSFTGALEATSPPQALPQGEKKPFLVGPNYATGPLELEIELPAGQQSFVYRTEAEGWDCEALAPTSSQPARALCENEALVAPGGEYPPLTVIARLGADAPDPASARVTASGGGAAAAASGEISFPIEPAVPFGLSLFTAPLLDLTGDEYTQAGGHPFRAESELALRLKRALANQDKLPVAELKQLVAELPPGVLGNPQALPELCALGVFCPQSAVGIVRFVAQGGGLLERVPLYAARPESGAPAELYFQVIGNFYTLIPHLRPADGYAIDLELSPAPKEEVSESRLTLCSFGVKDVLEETCREPGEAEANPEPFLTAPTSCDGPLETRVRLNSWEDPTYVAGPTFTGAAMQGCDEVPFEPKMKVTPTTNRADSPTGLDAELTIPTEGLEQATGCHEVQGDETSPLAEECIAQSNLEDVEVTLPRGLVVNPSGANGLAACSESQVGMSHAGLPNDDPARCPDASKIGSVEITTPLLDEPLDGAVYQAAQDANPFGSTLAIYVVAESKQRGVRVKLPGKVSLDPDTGQITSTFEENPQLPFGSFELKFFGGAAAPLRTPASCGAYSTTSKLTPWSAPGSPVTRTNGYAISQAPGGGDCPTSAGALPNSPSFDAGTISPIAGAFSPLVMHLRREDGSQEFGRLTLSPPPGLLGRLAGIPACSDAALAAAEASEGRDEEASPSCPAASQVGTVAVAAGAGPAPYHTTGKAYLAGPYKGAPLSIAIVAPATAGPFDLGTVVVRTALYVDPATAQVKAVSDPIPHILEGIPLDVRSIALKIDHPGWALNPTSCEAMSFDGELTSTLGAGAGLANRFQVGECGRLKFKPHITLRLRGGVRRTAHPKLIATVYSRGLGVANLAKTQVKLPRSAFLDQAHIRTVCTRVQWAAGEGHGSQCPKGSIYGKVWVKSPLFDYWLAGDAYLRSSNHELPDLVLGLNGPPSQPVHVELAGKTDSVKGALRNTFETIPDAPFTKARVVLFGGKRGLVVNSRNLCAQPKRARRANVRLVGQNGKTSQLRPLVRTSCGKAHRKRHKRHRHEG